MAKTMYVVQADDGMFYCGMRHWDKQLRKAKIYHSWDFADDIVSAYEECNCKIVEVSLAIVQETNTNADRIRAMSDEELAGMLNRIIICHQLRLDGWWCSKCPLYGAKPCDTEGIIDWLKQPAED